MNKKPSILLVAIAMILGAAFAAAAEVPAAPKVTYQDHVLPILRNACLNCHNPDKKKGNLDLSTFAGMSAGGSGKVVEPGDPDGSKLMKLITWAEEPNMPPKGDKLPEKELAVIRNWIAGGAPENSGSKIAAIKPKANLAVVGSTIGKPTGPVAMPKNLPADPVVVTRRAAAVVSLASSPWAPLVAVGGQKQIVLYHADTFDVMGVLPFPEGIPYVLKFSRNGSLLMAGGGMGAKSGKVVVFDVATGKRVAEVGDEYDAVIAADILPDQSQVAIGTPLRTVKIYNTSDGSVEHTMKKHTDWAQALAYSPDGSKLATGDRSGGLFVWEAKTGNEYLNLAGHKEGITDCAFRGDSAILASASQDGTIRLWNLDEGKTIKSINAHGGGVTSIAFTHDGRLISCGRDGLVKLWSPDGSPLKTFERFNDIALKVTFNYDGSRVVAGDYTGEIRVWNVADAKRAGELTANPPTRAQQISQLEQKIKELTQNSDKAKAELQAAEGALKQLNEAKSANAPATQKSPAQVQAEKKAAAARQQAIKSAQERLGKAQATAKEAADALAAAGAKLQRLQSK